VIGREAFRAAKSLEKIVIPESVVEIGDRAFFDCPRLNIPALPEDLRLGDKVFTV
jgi:hypothetical protein